MTLPLYRIAAADPAVQAALGGPEPRLYPGGSVPMPPAYPYAVYHVLTGEPENYLACRADIDSITVQLDVYAQQYGQAAQVAGVLRAALEGGCTITRLGGETRDKDTGSYRAGFDSDWWMAR